MASQETWIIGSSTDCDVVIDHAAVSRKHARLTHEAGRYFLEDLGSSNGTFVNEQAILTSTLVSPRDRITLGKQAAFVWPQIRPAPRVVSIGRASDNDVVLDLPNISVHHARLIIEGDSVVLEDMHSTNGTYLGLSRQPIQRSPIAITDVIHLGSHEVLLRELLLRANVEWPSSGFPVTMLENIPAPGNQPADDNCSLPQDSREMAPAASADEPAGAANSTADSGFGSLAGAISAAPPIHERRGRPRRKQTSAVGLGTYNLVVLIVGILGLAAMLWLRANHLKIQLIDVDELESQQGSTPR